MIMKCNVKEKNFNLHTQKTTTTNETDRTSFSALSDLIQSNREKKMISHLMGIQQNFNWMPTIIGRFRVECYFDKTYYCSRFPNDCNVWLHLGNICFHNNNQYPLNNVAILFLQTDQTEK